MSSSRTNKYHYSRTQSHPSLFTVVARRPGRSISLLLRPANVRRAPLFPRLVVEALDCPLGVERVADVECVTVVARVRDVRADEPVAGEVAPREGDVRETRQRARWLAFLLGYCPRLGRGQAGRSH